MTDFRVTNYGSVWRIEAVSPEAIAFTSDSFAIEDWQGLSENFVLDWRPARDLVQRLIAEGWRVS
jgi:hypothetical protein